MQQQDLISLLRKKELLHRLTDLVQIGVKTLFDLNSYRPLPEVLVASTSLTQSDVNKLFDINQFNSPTCAINQIQRHTLNEVQSPKRKTNKINKKQKQLSGNKRKKAHTQEDEAVIDISPIIKKPKLRRSTRIKDKNKTLNNEKSLEKK
eukprot:295928_1